MADLTQYAIDVAARMTGRETFAELDRLSATLSGSGKEAEHFQRAIQTLSGQLSSASEVNTAAQEKLAAGQARYRELEVALDRASKAAERAAKKNEGVVPFGLAAQVAAAESALDAHAMGLEDVEKRAKATADAEKRLSGQLQNVRTMAARVDRRLSLGAEELSKLQSGLGATGTGFGRLGSRMLGPIKAYGDMRQVVGNANAALLVTASIAAGVVVAIAAIGAAAAAAAIGVTALVVGLANARRNLDLEREGAEALHPELVGLRGDIAAIGDTTGLTEDKIRGLAGQLKKAKVSAADMPAALRAMATAEAAVEGGGAAFVEQIRKGNKAVSKLAAEAQATYGGIVARKMLSLGALGDRLKKNLAGLFDGIDIEPVLAGIKTLIDLFDKNTATGRAMKAVFEGVFQPIIDHAQEAAWAIEAFALGVGIGMLKAYRAVKPTVKAIEKALDIDTSEFDLEATLAGITKAAEVVAPPLLVVAAAVASVVAIIGALVAAVTVIPFGVATVAGLALAEALLYIWNAVKRAGEALSGVGSAVVGTLSSAKDAVFGFIKTLAAVGGAIIDGLIGGITAGAQRVVSALTGVVSGAISAAKSALGISSPSRVMAAEVAGPMVSGAEVTLERGTKRVQAALTAMVEPPKPQEIITPLQSISTIVQPQMTAATQASAPVQGAPTGGGPSVDLRGAQLTFNGVADAPTGIERFAEMLTRALEGDALAIGAPA